jgi:hypothetical protein
VARKRSLIAPVADADADDQGHRQRGDAAGGRQQAAGDSAEPVDQPAQRGPARLLIPPGGTAVAREARGAHSSSLAAKSDRGDRAGGAGLARQRGELL